MNILPKKMNKIFLILLSILIIFLMSSCGFHARGNVTLPLPLQKIYIKTKTPYGTLAQNLREYLKMSHIYVADSPEQASTILDIISEQTSQQLLGVSGSQQTRQYNLTLSIIFQITTPTGIPVTPPETLIQTRTLPINSAEVLSGSNQATALFQQMRRSIVFDLMNRLSSKEIAAVVTHQVKSSE